MVLCYQRTMRGQNSEFFSVHTPPPPEGATNTSSTSIFCRSELKNKSNYVLSVRTSVKTLSVSLISTTFRIIYSDLQQSSISNTYINATSICRNHSLYLGQKRREICNSPVHPSSQKLLVSVVSHTRRAGVLQH